MVFYAQELRLLGSGKWPVLLSGQENLSAFIHTTGRCNYLLQNSTSRCLSTLNCSEAHFRSTISISTFRLICCHESILLLVPFCTCIRDWTFLHYPSTSWVIALSMLLFPYFLSFPFLQSVFYNHLYFLFRNSVCLF